MPAMEATRLPTTGPTQRNDNASPEPPPLSRRWPLTLTTPAAARPAAHSAAAANRIVFMVPFYCGVGDNRTLAVDPSRAAAPRSTRALLDPQCHRGIDR